MLITDSTPYQSFIYALKSKDVKRQYPVMFQRFLEFIEAEGETLEEKCFSFYKFSVNLDNRKSLEYTLMKYISFQEERIKKREISSGTLRNYLKAIKLFFIMNDILVNWDKIKMGMSAVNQTSSDRIPEISELNKLIDYNDIRIKPIVLTMISSGIRVGAWDWLKWKHVIPIKREGAVVAAKIIVYAGEPEQYFSFITPEAYFSLNSYIDFRGLHGEKIDGDSWLIRDQWQKISKNHGHRIGQAGNPKKFDAEGIRRLIYDSWKIQGVLIAHESTLDGKHHPFKSSHGFRKFFQTQCEFTIKSEDVEILMGHGSSMRGMKANYYRPSEDYLLNQYLKVVDLLTLGNENKLKLKIEELSNNVHNEELFTKKLTEKDIQIKKIQDDAIEKENLINQIIGKLSKVEKELKEEKKIRNSFGDMR